MVTCKTCIHWDLQEGSVNLDGLRWGKCTYAPVYFPKVKLMKEVTIGPANMSTTENSDCAFPKAYRPKGGS